MTVGEFFNLLLLLITGAIAGYVASLLLRAARQGCLVNVILGIAGAFVGGFVMNTLMPQGIFGPPLQFLDTILHATIGAVIILIVLELVLPGRQLGVRDDGDGDGGGGRRGRRRSKSDSINPFDLFR